LVHVYFGARANGEEREIRTARVKAVARCDYACSNEFPNDLPQQFIEPPFFGGRWKFQKTVKPRIELSELSPTIAVCAKAAEEDFSH
jgi:hypothetical protein